MPKTLSGLVANRRPDMLDVDIPTRLLQQITVRNSLDLISLLPEFRNRIGDSETEFEKYYLSGDGHWTLTGHRLAADLVAPEITRRRP
jgi:hypothetical protein